MHDATYDPRVSAGSSPSTNACKMSRQDKNPWKCAFFSSSTGAERMPCLASAAIASPTVAVRDTVTTVDGGRVSRNRRSDHPNSRRRAGSRSGGVNVVSAVVAVFRVGPSLVLIQVSLQRVAGDLGVRHVDVAALTAQDVADRALPSRHAQGRAV